MFACPARAIRACPASRSHRLFKGSAHRAIPALLAAAVAALPSALFATSDVYTGPNTASWNTTSNWSPAAVPINGDDVAIGAFSPVRSGVTITITFNATNLSGTGLNSLTLDSLNCQLVDLLLNGAGGPLIAKNETVGNTITLNTLDHSAGNNTVSGNLTIGQSAGSSGTYNLSGTGNLTVANLFVASSGSGLFNQTGGTVNCTTDLKIGIVGAGTYTISSGTLTTAAGLVAHLGENGAATMNIQGGAVSIPQTLIVAAGTGNSTLNISSGSLTAGLLYIANTSGGTGVINQTGGSVNVTSSLRIGLNSGAHATYNLTAGSLSAIEEEIGTSGPNAAGAMVHTGGTNTASSFYLGFFTASVGNYTLDNSVAAVPTLLSAVNEYIGYIGTGIFLQNAGTNSVGNLSLGFTNTGVGNYTLAGGNLTVTNSLTLGNAAGLANFTQSGGNLTTPSLLLANGTSNATLHLAGGSFAATSVSVGSGGTGLVDQTAGSATIGVLLLGAGSLGNYSLSGTGLLTITGTEILGAVTPAVFNQSNGTHTLNGNLQLGTATALGTYNLTNGTLNGSASLHIGDGGQGTFTQSGGLVSPATVLVGNLPGSTGAYILNGGNLSVSSISVGVNGSGTLSISNGTATLSALIIDGGISTSATVNLSGGLLTLPNSPTAVTMGPSAVFNQSGGTLNGYFTNSAAFNFSNGSIGATLENALQGTLTFTGAALTATGDIRNHGAMNVSSSVGTTALHSLFNDGTLTINPGGQISTAGTLVNNGVINAVGSVGGTGIFSNNNIFTQGNGTLTFAFATATNNGVMTLASGRSFSLVSNITNNATFALNGALTSGGGTLINSPGATVTGPGNFFTGFVNNGTLLPGAGALNISAPWNNTGVVELSGLNSSLIGAAVTNTGTIQGIGTVGSPIVNTTGTVEPLGGTLILSGVASNALGATLTAGTGNKLLLTAGLPTNAGLIDLAGGTIDNGGQPLNNTGQISGYGTLRTGGLTNNGLFTLSGTNGNTTTVNGDILNTANHTLNIEFNPALFTGNITNNANATIKTTNTTATFAGTFTNHGFYPSDPSTNIFQGPVANDGSMTGSAGDVFTFASSFSNAGTFTNGGNLKVTGNVTNSGTFSQSGPQSWSSTSTFANAGGTATFSSNAKLANLTITGGTVDLTTSKFIVEPTSKIPTLQALQTDANNGSLTASGLSANLALAIIDNGSLLTPFTLFGGMPADTGSILIAPELLGDANIDGHVDLNDLNTVLNHLGTTNAGWTWGGFDGQSTVDLNDLNDVLNHLGLTYANSSSAAEAQSLLATPITPTPEPGSLTLVLLAAPLLVRRTSH